MTNTTYFFDAVREEWSASTSPNETPRPSFVDAHASAAASSGGIGVISDGDKWEPFNFKLFSFQELQTATRYFAVDGVLDKGGFGRVYKGWIDHENTQIAVAVKSLHQHQDHSQGPRECLAEVKYSSQLHHPNLMRLFGYCSADERLLVYEFMPRGSLDNHLFRRDYSCPLSWSLRMKIALGVAKGLAFLHTAQINVIHRDIQSSHILLDLKYNAKLSGFGLAMGGPTGDMSHVSTVVMGTYGYAAPEYICTGDLTTKCDVYNFGVVLLEILSGRRTIDKSRPPKEQQLVNWARPYLNHKKKISHILDNHLNGKCDLRDALKFASLAYRCLSWDPERRPNMNEVTKVLGEMQKSEDT